MRVLLPTILATLLLLAPLAAAAVVFPGAPLHTAGDNWDVQATLENARFGTMELSGTFRVASVGPYAFHGATVTAVHDVGNLSGSGTVQGLPLSGHVDFELWALDLDESQLYETFHTVITSNGQTLFDSTETRDWKDPCPLVRFPLQTGAAWNVTCVVTTNQTSSSLTTGSASTSTTNTTVSRGSISGEELVVVPAGAYHALVAHVNVTGESRGGREETQWLALETCQPPKTVERSDQTTFTLQLASVHCAQAGKTHVPTPVGPTGGSPSGATATSSTPGPALPLVLAGAGLALLVRRARR